MRSENKFSKAGFIILLVFIATLFISAVFQKEYIAALISIILSVYIGWLLISKDNPGRHVQLVVEAGLYDDEEDDEDAWDEDDPTTAVVWEPQAPFEGKEARVEVSAPGFAEAWRAADTEAGDPFAEALKAWHAKHNPPAE